MFRNDKQRKGLPPYIEPAAHRIESSSSTPSLSIKHSAVKEADAFPSASARLTCWYGRSTILKSKFLPESATLWMLLKGIHGGKYFTRRHFSFKCGVYGRDYSRWGMISTRYAPMTVPFSIISMVASASSRYYGLFPLTQLMRGSNKDWHTLWSAISTGNPYVTDKTMRPAVLGKAYLRIMSHGGILELTTAIQK